MKTRLSLVLALMCLSLGACDTTSPAPASAPSQSSAARTTTLGSNIPRPADEAPATPTYGAGGGNELRDALGRSNR